LYITISNAVAKSNIQVYLLKQAQNVFNKSYHRHDTDRNGLKKNTWQAQIIFLYNTVAKI